MYTLGFFCVVSCVGVKISKVFFGEGSKWNKKSNSRLFLLVTSVFVVCSIRILENTFLN